MNVLVLYIDITMISTASQDVLTQIRPYVFLFYGILKLIIAIPAMVSPKVKAFYAKVPLVNFLVTEDESVSGLVYEYVILAFGIYSFFEGVFGVLHGPLAIKNHIVEAGAAFFHSVTTQTVVMTLLGVVYVLFFTWSIAKLKSKSKDAKFADPNYEVSYWQAIAFGILFIESALVLHSGTITNRVGSTAFTALLTFLTTVSIYLMTLPPVCGTTSALVDDKKKH